MADSDGNQQINSRATQVLLFDRDIKGKQFSCRRCGELELGRLPRTKLCKKCLAKEKGLPDCLCATCGKDLPRDRIAGLTSDRKPILYCSRQCMFESNRGENHHAWNGGKIVDVGGYVKVRVEGNYVQEHRIVMERAIGRKLHRWETVHHKDGDRKNNHISNLQLMGTRHPRGQFYQDWVEYLMTSIVQENPQCFVSTNFTCEGGLPSQIHVTNAYSGESLTIPLV